MSMKTSISLIITTILTYVVVNLPVVKYMKVKKKYVCCYVLVLTKYLLVECGSQAVDYIQQRFMISS
jgi:hypothetical protein